MTPLSRAQNKLPRAAFFPHSQKPRARASYNCCTGNGRICKSKESDHLFVMLSYWLNNNQSVFQLHIYSAPIACRESRGEPQIGRELRLAPFGSPSSLPPNFLLSSLFPFFLLPSFLFPSSFHPSFFPFLFT